MPCDFNYFIQTAFLKSYIKYRTELRKHTGKEGKKIKKQNTKLKNNAICGKSIETPMNKFDLKIVDRWKIIT